MTAPWVSESQRTRVAIVSGVRTPFAKAGMQLSKCSAVHLGTVAAREALAQASVSPGDLDEVVFGNAGTPPDAANIGRVIALRAGVPQSVPGYTVHRNCASAMEAVAQGCIKISSGLAKTVLVGGTESMTNMPIMFGEEMKAIFGKLSSAKTAAAKLSVLASFRPAMLSPVIGVMQGLTDPISGLNMGQTAEVLARDFHIDRKEQDQFALRSHQRAVEAKKSGKFAEEMTPVPMEPDYANYLAEDIGPRDGQSMEALSKLKPFFDRENGTVTAGNACPITDGAAALVLMDEKVARSEGRNVLGTISAFAFSGCEPKRMGLGPLYSTARVLKAAGWSLSDVDLVELNEAFAAQVIANQRAFASESYCQDKLNQKALGELPDDRLNVNGGAIALGHPVGTTGIRILLTLLKEMSRRSLGRGLATLCIGGGQGAAFLVERT